MKGFYLSLPAGLTAKLTAGFEFDRRALLLAQAYVPGAREARSKPRKCDINISWTGGPSLDLWHLLYSAARRELLKKMLFSVHGACVGDTLIVGHSGTGKTSVLLELVRKYGMKIFSGNKTVVSFKKGQLAAVAGTRTMSTRSKDGWRRFFLEKGQYSKKNKLKIRNIALVRLNDGVNEFRRLEPLGALHTLYPYFLDVVNADTIAGGKIFDGTPPKGARERLVAGLTSALGTTQVYAVSGSKRFIVKKIAKP